MTNTIFGREAEVKKLERLLKSTKAEFLAIYGRRRVGKTYLIHEFFKDKGLYFCVTGSLNSNKKLQLRKFWREIRSVFPQTYDLQEPKDWDEALYSLKELIGNIDTNKKIIVFFDELPWLASNRSGFLPALEYTWNQYFSHMHNVILIVCGSAANWIIKKIINNKGGLYGRLSEVIKLNPFSLGETEKFLLAHNVKLARKQLAELYMSIGGIAKYLTYIHSGESTAQIINRLCFSSQGQLTHEFQNLYQSLFDDSHKHMMIIKKLAEKKSGIPQKELLEKLHIPSGGQVSTTLEELEESGFITTCPEFQKKNRDKRIWLLDEYSYFYITWMENIKGSIVLGNDQDYWLKMQSQQRWKVWAGYAFESICFKHIAQIKKALGISAVLTTESQWSYKTSKNSEKGAQIDLVIDRKDDCINLCEIKFHHSTFTIDQKYASELEHKVSLFREKTKTSKTIFLTFITPFGFYENEYASALVNCQVTLNDLFE